MTEEKKRGDTFLPIPSLNNLYEINKKGVVRNAKTKHVIQPVVNVKIDGRYVSRSINTFMWEVHGIRRKDCYAKNIPVSAEKDGKKYYFQSYHACANFITKAEYYEKPTAMSYLRKRREIIFGWKIKYFDEPRHADFAERIAPKRKDIEQNENY